MVTNSYTIIAAAQHKGDTQSARDSREDFLGKVTEQTSNMHTGSAELTGRKETKNLKSGPERGTCSKLGGSPA